MAQIFPKWSNKVPTWLVIGVHFKVVAIVGFFWYYGSPEYTDVGYRPNQPVPYSHKLHAGDLGLDCRYCHSTVEISSVSVVPPTSTCMNCHALVKTDSPKLALVRESFATGKPIEWIRIHNIPDYAYFNHSAHITAGVGCETCHGNIAEMEEVGQVEPLSMSWCLECHRAPEMYLREAKDVTKMGWVAPDNQMEIGRRIVQEKNITPPVDCSGCHR